MKGKTRLIFCIISLLMFCTNERGYTGMKSNNEKSSINNKRAVVLAGPGYEEREFFYAYYRLQEANFIVDVVTSNNEQVKGKFGIPIEPTIKLGQLDAKKYDLVVIPGGYESPDKMRQVNEILNFVRQMNQYGKIISSTCHGPWVLASAGILKNRKATCYRGCKDDVINAGANYIDEPVVVDSNIITAQHYKDNPAWMRETLKTFESNVR